MKDELRDRFGEVPTSVENLIRISLVREKAHNFYVLEIKGGNGEITIKLNNNARLNGAKIPALLEAYKGKLEFRAGSYPLFIYKYVKNESNKVAEEELLNDTEKLVEYMQILSMETVKA